MIDDVIAMTSRLILPPHLQNVLREIGSDLATNPISSDQ